MRIDLHTHSTASDGTDAPAQVIAQASAVGLDVVALTDHESTSGWASARTQARLSGIGFVPGIECSAKLGRLSVHVLGYLIDPDNAELTAMTETVRTERHIRADRIIAALSRDFPITVQDVSAQVTGDATIGRPHIADALVARGVVPDRSTAFRTILRPGSPYYASTFAPPPVDVVARIRAAGGVPVLAHPGRGLQSGELDEPEIRRLCDAGLLGIEVWHRENDDAVRARLQSIAEHNGLIPTGSSDFHGTGKPNRLGENTTPEESLERILAAGTGSAASL